MRFLRLTNEAKVGDQMVILLGGHLEQQPDQEPFDEPDGLDQTVLPYAAGPWNPDTIIDDKFDFWTKARPSG